MSSSVTYLFVYGTLRRSDAFPMHRLLLPATFVGCGTIPGTLYDVGSYPAAVFSDQDSSRVHGEVYLLHDPEATLARLDRYEGCTSDDPSPHEYVRTTADVLMQTGEKLSAQVYLYNRASDHLSPILSGDYLARRSC